MIIVHLAFTGNGAPCLADVELDGHEICTFQPIRQLRAASLPKIHDICRF